MKRTMFVAVVLAIFAMFCVSCAGGNYRAKRPCPPCPATTVTTATITVYQPIIVDYSRSLEEMIAIGHYNPDAINSNITADHFPVVGSGKQTFTPKLVQFDRIKSDDVLDELGRRALRPATLPELLAFGNWYPEEQRKFQIFALGSVWTPNDGYRRVAFLFAYNSCRGLGLDFFNWGNVDQRHFLAVDKEE